MAADEKDPFAGVESDPLGESGGDPLPGELAGDGESLEELGEEPGGVPAEEETEPQPEPAPEPEPEPQAESESESKPQPAPEPEGEAKGESSNGNGKKVKKGTAERDYVILAETEGGDFEQHKPLRAGNTEAALREAYTRLDTEDEVTLVAVPAHFFKPKTVKAKKRVSRAVEIG